MVQGFENAMREYEYHMTAPYDAGGALYNYEEEYNEREDYLETQAEYRMEEMFLRGE